MKSIKSELILDRNGRVVLPKALRNALGLSAGDILDLTVEGDEVTLRPRRAATHLQKEFGVNVLHTSRKLTTQETNETLRGLREQRGRGNLGEKS